MTNAPKDQTQEKNGSGFAGTLRNIQLTDIIQMCCLAGASLCVRVDQDADQGMIYIQEGEVVHAKCGNIDGVKAFFAILGWQSGHFETLEAETVTNPTIKEPCQFLLMEATRLADEQAVADAQSSEKQVSKVEKLKVLIVDDSPIMSKILRSMLSADPSIDVAGIAKNGEEALEKLKSIQPHLITMDVNMPVMDGSTALKHIMIGSPSPVLIMSNLGPASYATILTFLNLGAVDFMSKPVKNKNIITQQQKMVDRVHVAAKAKVKRFQRFRRPKINRNEFVAIDESRICSVPVIVSSGVGGYLEMVNVITALPKSEKTSLLSLQSIPPHFAPTLSAFLTARSRFEVKPVYDQAPLCPGRCYIGTSGVGLKIEKQGHLKYISPNVQDEKSIDDESSFDRLLQSMVEKFKDRVIVILLSGAELGSMEGLRQVKSQGGKIIVPKLASCILPATLEPAVDQGVITELFDPSQISEILKRYCT